MAASTLIPCIPACQRRRKCPITSGHMRPERTDVCAVCSLKQLTCWQQSAFKIVQIFEVPQPMLQLSVYFICTCNYCKLQTTVLSQLSHFRPHFYDLCCWIAFSCMNSSVPENFYLSVKPEDQLPLDPNCTKYIQLHNFRTHFRKILFNIIVRSTSESIQNNLFH